MLTLKGNWSNILITRVSSCSIPLFFPISVRNVYHDFMFFYPANRNNFRSQVVVIWLPESTIYVATPWLLLITYWIKRNSFASSHPEHTSLFAGAVAFQIFITTFTEEAATAPHSFLYLPSDLFPLHFHEFLFPLPVFLSKWHQSSLCALLCSSYNCCKSFFPLYLPPSGTILFSCSFFLPHHFSIYFRISSENISASMPVPSNFSLPLLLCII